jgi:predicted MFS family arabinose efflux permease
MRTPGSAAAFAGRLFGPQPFARLVHAHALSAAADACFAVSLAGSLFFNVSVDAARPRIVLYLVLTMAPFAVLAPVIGPVIDRVRGGHRLVLGLTCVLRAVVALVMASHLKTLFFYPEAFAILVLGKTYSVAKSALVPRLVEDHEGLVAANSRLSRLSTLGAGVGGAVGAGILNLTAAPWTLRTAAVVYLVAAACTTRLPRPRPAGRPTSRALEREEVHAPRIVIAATAMAVLRAAVGFSFFLVAIALRRAGEPAWVYGAVLAGAGVGGFVGTFLAPPLRRVVHEVPMLALSLLVPAVLALFAATSYGRISVVTVVLALGIGANVGRQAFDSLVQRDAPDADRGRVFAAFETRFQLAWVLGALVPVAVHLPPALGVLLLAVALLAGALSLLTGTRAAERRAPLPPGGLVREVIEVGDDAPIAVRLLLTAERLALDALHDQAVLVAGAAADAAGGGRAPANDGASDQDELDRLRARALDPDRAVGATEAATAIELATRAVARAARLPAATPDRRHGR